MKCEKIKFELLRSLFFLIMVVISHQLFPLNQLYLMPLFGTFQRLETAELETILKTLDRRAMDFRIVKGPFGEPSRENRNLVVPDSNIQENGITLPMDRDKDIGLLVVGFIGISRFLTTQYPYNFMPVFSPSEEAEVIRSLGQFSPTNKYVFRSVDRGRQGENVLIIYINWENGQKLFTSLLREHISDHLNQIQVLSRTKVERTFTMAGFENRTVPNFKFVYLLPFFRKDDLSGMGDEAIIQGINVKSQERFETPAAEIFM